MKNTGLNKKVIELAILHVLKDSDQKSQIVIDRTKEILKGIFSVQPPQIHWRIKELKESGYLSATHDIKGRPVLHIEPSGSEHIKKIESELKPSIEKTINRIHGKVKRVIEGERN